MNYNAAVVQAIPGENFTVYAYYSDGSVRLADIKPLISKGGVFERLRDEHIFRDTLTVINHAVAWDLEGDRDATKCIDIDPCSMYESSKIVKDPLIYA